MRELTEKQHRKLDRLEEERPDTRVVGWYSSRKRGLSGPMISDDFQPATRLINHTGFIVGI